MTDQWTQLSPEERSSYLQTAKQNKAASFRVYKEKVKAEMRRENPDMSEEEALRVAEASWKTQNPVQQLMFTNRVVKPPQSGGGRGLGQMQSPGNSSMKQMSASGASSNEQVRFHTILTPSDSSLKQTSSWPKSAP